MEDQNKDLEQTELSSDENEKPADSWNSWVFEKLYDDFQVCENCEG